MTAASGRLGRRPSVPGREGHPVDTAVSGSELELYLLVGPTRGFVKR